MPEGNVGTFLAALFPSSVAAAPALGSLQGNDDERPTAPPASRLPSLTLPEAMCCFQADF